MSAQFGIGTMVEGKNYIFWPELNGMQCSIVEGLAIRTGTCVKSGVISTKPTYIVEWASGLVSLAAPYNLRRRKPPAADSNERTFMQRWRDMADKAPQRVGETV
jgi:hypothetical protein